MDEIDTLMLIQPLYSNLFEVHLLTFQILTQKRKPISLNIILFYYEKSLSEEG